MEEIPDIEINDELPPEPSEIELLCGEIHSQPDYVEEIYRFGLDMFNNIDYKIEKSISLGKGIKYTYTYKNLYRDEELYGMICKNVEQEIIIL